MTDQNDYDSDTEGEGTPESAAIRALRAEVKKLTAEAKANAEGSAKAQKLERELLFRDAGIDPANPLHKYFSKGYDGDLTVEAIRSEAQTAGLLTPPPPAVPAGEMAANAAIDAAFVGAEPPNTGGADAELLQALTQAKNAAEFDLILTQKGALANE